MLKSLQPVTIPSSNFDDAIIDQKLDYVAQSVSSLKQIASEIQAELELQSSLIDRIDSTVEQTQANLSKSKKDKKEVEKTVEKGADIQGLVKMQKANGSWLLTSVSSFTGVSESKIKEKIPDFLSSSAGKTFDCVC